MTEETLDIDVELDDETMKALTAAANEKGMTPSELASEIVNNAIKNNSLDELFKDYYNQK